MASDYLQKMEEEFNQAVGKPSDLSWSDIRKFAEHRWDNFERTASIEPQDIEGKSWEVLVFLLAENMMAEEGYIYTCDEHWLWQKLVQAAFEARLAHLALLALYQADLFLAKRSSQAWRQFYALDYDPNNSTKHDRFIKRVREGESDLVLQELAEMPKWLDPQKWPDASETFTGTLETLQNKLPQEEAKEEQSAQQQTTSSSPQPAAQRQQHSQPSLAKVSSTPNAPATLPKEFVFLEHLYLPQFIYEFLSLYQNQQFHEAERCLHNACYGGNLAQRFLFLARLLRTECLFQLAEARSDLHKEIKAVLESLWLQVYSLFPDFTPEKPYEAVMAKWDPVLYGQLVKLTLHYSEKYNNHEGFEVPFHHFINEDKLRLNLVIIGN